MQDEKPLNPADRELAEALASLKPADASFAVRDIVWRSRIQYEVRLRRGWQALAACLTLMATGLLLQPGRTSTVDRIVYLPPPAQTAPVAVAALDRPAGPYSYADLRRRMLDGGLDDLPAPPALGQETAPSALGDRRPMETPTWKNLLIGG